MDGAVRWHDNRQQRQRRYDSGRLEAPAGTVSRPARQLPFSVVSRQVDDHQRRQRRRIQRRRRTSVTPHVARTRCGRGEARRPLLCHNLAAPLGVQRPSLCSTYSVYSVIAVLCNICVFCSSVFLPVQYAFATSVVYYSMCLQQPSSTVLKIEALEFILWYDQAHFLLQI